MGWILSALLAGSLLSGCFVRSLHPLFAEREQVFDATLLGAWVQDEDPDVSIIFSRYGERAYQAEFREPGRTRKYLVSMGKLGEGYYFDVMPVDDSSVDDHFLPAHSIWRVRWEQDTLRMASLDHDWLRDLLRRSRPLAFEWVEGDIVLTASTSELQRFLLRHGSEPGAFGKEESVFHRR
ncbi:MAG: hypothetical protein ACRD2R_08270 [Terriglobales bacterium]